MGFSLIEVMIAMAMGMAAVIIMMQMLSASDTAKRITVGGNDAQITGTIALFNLERDLRSAGFGINSDKLLGCNITFKTVNGDTEVTIPLAPVTIFTEKHPGGLIPAGDPNTDTMLIVYAKTNESSEGDALRAASSSDQIMVTTPTAFKKDDELVLSHEARGTPCNLHRSKVKTEVTSETIDITDGQVGFPAGSIAFNLGRLTARAYAVRNGTLTMCDFHDNDCRKDDDEIWTPVAANVVALLAQYGRDLSNTSEPLTGAISEYTRIPPGEHDNDKKALLAPQCAWARTVSVRIGLVARSAAHDKDLTDPKKQALIAPPTWSGANDVNFDLTESLEGGEDGAWQRYRYKAFETSVPLRDMIWQGDPNC